ncbi:MAG TPA: methyl-accepting chemotaxis protein [bacterium]|nr:methyl-accepting chemotaxis protein [bacterium]HPS28938.1 methyl-accepting chemotaxis protein [bacterium]
MMGFRDWYLKWKLLAINLVITFVFSVITIVATRFMVSDVSDSVLESNLKNILNTVYSQVETVRRINTTEFQDSRSAQRIMREIEAGLTNIILDGGTTISVIDANTGTWITHPTGKGQNWSTKYDYIKTIINTGDGTINFTPESGHENTAVYLKYKPLNWILIASAPSNASDFIASFGVKSVLLFIFVMLLYALLTYFVVEWIIISPLRQINEAFRKGAKGDLDVMLVKRFNDEIGEMTENFNEFITTLKNIIYSIRNTAENILNSSNEISGGNNQLSSATQQMASSLEETAASIEEISASIHDTAEVSVTLTDNITQTASRAEKGKEHLKQMEKAIGQVKDSGARISEIVDMVNSIAFHTNLLALNAAVEAARAGEQGKGFAVVASEVRSLAQRSADAASEIKQLVDSNEEMTTNASNITRMTSQILMDVVFNIQNNAAEMREIEGRSKEQSKGIRQINSAIMQMDEVTQRNAALVEQLASSAMDMAAISKNLNDEVMKFKLSENEIYVPKTDVQQFKEITKDPYSIGFENKKSPDKTGKDTFEESDFSSNSFLDDDQFEEF